MRKKIELAVKIFIGATFFVPLVLVPSSYIFPFIVPKILVFRSLALLMLGVYLLLLQVNWQKYKPDFNWINLSVGLFFISFVISTFVGADWYKSFWDNHERMLGLFTIFHFVIYYLVITSAVKEWRDWKWLLRIFLLAGMAVMIIGGMQKINPELLLNHGANRVSATLGNAIYFSGYGLFLLFISLLLAVKEPIRLRSGWFWYAVVGGIFGFLGIFWGGTKGTFLGFMTGGLILLFTYLFTAKEQKKLKYIAWSLLFLMVIVLGLLFNFRKSHFVRSIPAVGSLMNVSLSGTTETRLMAWDIAIKAWQEKPIFGWGPNNYYYAFNKYYNPKFLEHGWGETWFDNAHSAVMNTLAVQGAVGFLAYFLLFIIPAIVLIKSFKSGKVDKHVLAISLAFLAGHFVHNATVFENPTSYLYFFFFLAFINSQTFSSVIPVKTGIQKSERFSVGLGVVVGIIILLLIYSTDINPARANKGALVAMKGFYSGANVMDLYKNTAQITSPHIDDIRSDFARSAMQAIPLLIEKKYVKEEADLFNLVIEELKKNLILHPLDIRVHLMLAQLYIQQAQIEQSVSWMIKAEEILQTALDLSPKRQQVQYMLSGVKMQLNKSVEAIKIVQESIDSDPKITEGWWRLALFYKETGAIDKAKETVAEIRKRGMTFSDDIEKMLAGITEAK